MKLACAHKRELVWLWMFAFVDPASSLCVCLCVGAQVRQSGLLPVRKIQHHMHMQEPTRAGFIGRRADPARLSPDVDAVFRVGVPHEQVLQFCQVLGS